MILVDPFQLGILHGKKIKKKRLLGSVEAVGISAMSTELH